MVNEFIWRKILVKSLSILNDRERLHSASAMEPQT